MMNAATLKNRDDHKPFSVAIDNDAYHGDVSTISNSMLSIFIDNPVTFYLQYIKKTYKPKPKDSFLIGNAGHDIMLEGGKNTVVIPRDVLSKSGSKAGGAWDEFEAANAGKYLLKAAEHEAVMMMVESVLSEKPAADAFSWPGGIKEKAIYWTDEATGLRLRCKLDLRVTNPNTGAITVPDLKFVRSINRYRFAAQAAECGYYRQSAFYSMGVHALTGEWPAWFFIATEKEPTYPCQCFYLEQDFAAQGFADVRKGLNDLAESIRTNTWKRPGSGSILPLAKPRSLNRDDSDLYPEEN